ncbi:MAG: peptidase T [Treponema sp.]|nr:peptidase T [Treponema sp.]
MNYISQNQENKNKLLERFVKYVQIWSESNGELADKGIFPSTPQQFDFAKSLKSELEQLGLSDICLTEDCYLYGRLPGNSDTKDLEDSILLMAHMDTVDEVSGKDVKPQIIRDKKVVDFSGDETDTIITSDGSTLLGGDDKAGVAAIVSAISFLTDNPQIKHRTVEVLFSPDEETGHGMDRVPLDLIKSKCAYTVDGGSLGEMETECFNAWSATVEFLGKATHTGDAKQGKMVNAAVMASTFAANLPRHKAPETTENFEPFIALMNIEGTIEKAEVSLLLRAFTLPEIEEEKRTVEKIAQAVELSFGGKASVFFSQQYLNMKEKIGENPQVVERLEKAYNSAGVSIINKPIRGGTDGSRLTEMGIPTPNIFTGAHNFHSRNEWCSLNQMAKAADVLVNLLIEL